MVSLFASGRIVDIMLAITAIEVAALVVYYRRTGRGPDPTEILGGILSGACLMLALRAALVGAWWGWISLCLVAAFAVHLNDLRRRWLRPGR